MSASLYRQAVDAWNDRDVERFVSLGHEDCEFTSTLTQVEGGAYRGHDGLRRYFADLDGTLPDAQMRIESIEERGDWVVATLKLHGSGMASGVPLDWEVSQAAHVRDGLFDRSLTASSRAEVLAAAGLE